ncbi:hypothetical protein [Pelomonas sp. KK5]|uniref:hypothetical protein n=1 Tax=Pelomonas sp. KK5 TaxID=1855730 RepID=UPI00097BCB60|nr:hypothetical protein [Pelomonas sp. KK5]
MFTMNKRVVALLALCSAVSIAAAQDEGGNGKASREREALRRAQNALRAATSQQDALQADKAKLTQEKGQLEAQLKAEQGRQQSAAGRLKQAEQRGDSLQAEVEAARKAALAQDAAAQQREQELQQLLQAARRESAERLQAARALTTLLERSTLELAGAEEKNRKLYAIGRELVERYRGGSATDLAGIGDPVLGLAGVRLEDQAEALRGQLAQQRVR